MAFQPLTSPVDYIVLANRRSPGLATIEGLETPRNFVERRGFGTSFASLRFRGVSLSRFKVMLRLYTDQDWADWDAWKSLVRRPVQATGERGVGRRLAPALTIEHPILADFEITDVVVENVIQPVQTADGEWTIEIRFIEYHEPVVALEQPRSNQNGPRQPYDPAEATIAAQSAEIARLEAEYELSSPRGRASQ